MVEGHEQPALQVIVLGSGGGPKEDNATAFLVRSTSAEWKRGSVLAVDAGTHLAGVARILESYATDIPGNPPSSPMTLASGPFKGLQLPFASVDANAAYITRYLVDTYLVTHPHLDHISGFVINTAGLPGARPKRLAGLPSTIAAFKAHIFNNVIWPNLSDENNGVGLVTYMRLLDGGSPALGDGDGKGYVEICEGLSVKALSVSHGHCMERHSHRGSTCGLHLHDYPLGFDTSLQRSNSNPLNIGLLGKSSEHYDRRESHERVCVYDSSAYFIRDVTTGREVLIFGDVEPDSISLSPRNLQVWSDAAQKIASGLLTTIFIECSYDDSQLDDQLYGHLAPRFLIEEMKVLAGCVESARQNEIDKKRRKRKRPSNTQAVDHGSGPRRSPRLSSSGQYTPEARRSTHSTPVSWNNISPRSNSTRSLELDGAASDVPISPHTLNDAWPKLTDRSLQGPGPTSAPDGTTMAGTSEASGTSMSQLPLNGIKIVIIHIKDKLDGGPPAGETILKQLLDYEEDEKLGCEFVLAKIGMEVYL